MFFLNKSSLLFKTHSSRAFHTTFAAFKSVAITSQPSLHAHTVLSKNNEEKYAISFLSSDDLGTRKLENYPEIIVGWSDSQNSLDHKTFIENRQFVQFMTQTFKKHIHEVNDANLKAMAEWQKEGWMHIGDERDPPAWGRINFPEDIVGSVQVSSGTIVAGSYQAMPTHRIITTKGIFKLSDPLTRCVANASKQKLL